MATEQLVESDQHGILVAGGPDAVLDEWCRRMEAAVADGVDPLDAMADADDALLVAVL